MENNDQISYEAITGLLNKAYGKWNMQSIDFSAINQDAQTTIERIGDGVCLVVTCDDVLVGTMSYKLVKKEISNWYEDDTYLTYFQLAHDPDHSLLSLYTYFYRYLLKLEKKMYKDAGSVIIDTSIKAHKLVHFYKRIGFEVVDLVSWPSTNYYSFVFRKPLSGRKFRSLYRRARFLLSATKCILTKNRYGRYRLPFRCFKGK